MRSLKNFFYPGSLFFLSLLLQKEPVVSPLGLCSFLGGARAFPFPQRGPFRQARCRARAPQKRTATPLPCAIQPPPPPPPLPRASVAASLKRRAADVSFVGFRPHAGANQSPSARCQNMGARRFSSPKHGRAQVLA